ncbi:MAG: carbohydrate kinase family protein [Spirochaetes bacterium]|nr:carbohydrate kinase family protein [Spirochaetota bacterium]
MKYKNSGKIRISGTGCILADYFYTNIDFNGTVFQKYRSISPGDGGLYPGKLVFTEDLELFAGRKFEEIVSDLTGNRQSETANIGGPCIVALINVSQMMFQNYDCDVRFYGSLGNDVTAEFIKNSLYDTGVDVTGIKTFNAPSPYTSVFSDSEYDGGSGERIFVNNLGSALLFGPADLNENFFESDILVFGATALVPHIHDCLSLLLKKGKDNKCLNIVTTVYDFRNEKAFPGKAWPLADEDSCWLIDLLITSRDEALGISGKDSSESAMEYFRNLGIGAVIITHGPNPVMVYSGGNFFRERELTQIPLSDKILKIIRNDASGDSTGCGDNFAGGVIASTAMQLIGKHNSSPDLVEACVWGMASGAFANFHLGGMFVEKFHGEKYKKISEFAEIYKEHVKELKI